MITHAVSPDCASTSPQFLKLPPSDAACTSTVLPRRKRLDAPPGQLPPVVCVLSFNESVSQLTLRFRVFEPVTLPFESTTGEGPVPSVLPTAVYVYCPASVRAVLTVRPGREYRGGQPPAAHTIFA